jgi:excisionase family DNA binding protein
VNLTPGYLTKQHAMVIYDLKKRSIDAAIRAGQIRAFKIGKKILLDKASIDEWIQAHEIIASDRQTVKSELQKLMDRAIQHARRTAP